MSEKHECQYCGEEFDSELDRGIHISEEHVESGGIARGGKTFRSGENIVDEWEDKGSDDA